MYALLRDPDTGEKIYADIKIVTVEEVVDAVVHELRGVRINNRDLLKMVLRNVLNIPVEECTELVQAVEQKLLGVAL
jgi:hypothetical protein